MDNITNITISHQYPVLGRDGKPDYNRNTKFQVVTAEEGRVTYYRFDNELLASAEVYTAVDTEVYVRLKDVETISGRGKYFNVIAIRDCDTSRWQKAHLRSGVRGGRPAFIPVGDAIKLAKAYAQGAMHDSVVEFFRDIRRTMEGLHNGVYEAYGLKAACPLPAYMSADYSPRRRRGCNLVNEVQPAHAEPAEPVPSVVQDVPVNAIPQDESAAIELTQAAKAELYEQLGYFVSLRQSAQKSAERILRVLDIPAPW